MLSALGLQPVEEEIYRSLVSHVALSSADLVRLTDRSPGEIEDVLAGLVDRGLAAAEPSGATVSSRPPLPVSRWEAAPAAPRRSPSAEQALAALVEEHRVATIGRRHSSVIEEITDINAVRHRFLQIQETARYEVLSMVRPNLSVVPHRENIAEKAGLRRGVHYRAILDRKALSEPGMVDDAIVSIGAGQEIRVVDHVPVKVVIVDRERAMLPLLAGPHDAPDSMLVQSSGLLDVLIAFFELAWEHAYPLLPNAAKSDLIEARPDIDELDQRILALLLSGMTDEAVAGDLGTSRRTVQRRIHETDGQSRCRDPNRTRLVRRPQGLGLTDSAEPAILYPPVAVDVAVGESVDVPTARRPLDKERLAPVQRAGPRAAGRGTNEQRIGAYRLADADDTVRRCCRSACCRETRDDHGGEHSGPDPIYHELYPPMHSMRTYPQSLGPKSNVAAQPL